MFPKKKITSKTKVSIAQRKLHLDIFTYKIKIDVILTKPY